MTYKPLKNKLLLVFSAVLFSLILGLSINSFADGEGNSFSSLEEEIKTIVDEDENISVYVSTIDGDIGIGEEEVYSSASTIKVPILIEALRQGEQGILNLDEKVTVTDSDITSGGGIIRHMSDHQLLSIRDLLFLMITLSDNTTTNMAIERVGMGSVNNAMEEMGAENSILQRYMLESVTQGDNLTTAKDMVQMMKEAYEGDILSAESKEEFIRIMGEQKLTGNLPSYLDTTLHSGVSTHTKGGSLGSTGVRHDVGFFTHNDEVAFVSVMTQDVTKKTSQTTMAEIGEHIAEYLID
ncbi:serine hydrolase [Virgibacillus kimchii]